MKDKDAAGRKPRDWKEIVGTNYKESQRDTSIGNFGQKYDNMYVAFSIWNANSPIFPETIQSEQNLKKIYLEKYINFAKKKSFAG